MMVENNYSMLFHDPIVEETNVWDSSLRVILSDLVLNRHLKYLKRFSPRGSLMSIHVDWLYSIFPELLEQGNMPNPWVWGDLITRVSNVGSVQDAVSKFEEWTNDKRNVVYWTGGLEFTRNQYEVAEFLKSKSFQILLGIEPFCYPNEYAKERGSISGDAIPLSFWSKYIREKGFIFTIPRPLSSSGEERSKFYGGLYQQITNGRGYIVVSERDPFKDEKRKRGLTIEVPEFNYPTTTELYNSCF